MSPSSDPKPSARVLVVDDISDNRELLVRRLTRQGYTCVEAESGYAALDAMKRHAIDLILLDVSMPGISGLEVLAMLRKHFLQTQFPIIIVSADAQAENIALAKKLGANDYITKPVNFATALNCVAINLGLSRASMQVGEARRELRLAREALA